MLTNYDPTGEANFINKFNYWTSTNPSNDFPALNSKNKRDAYTGFYGLAYVDGSFFKIKNITVGYTMPKSLSNKLDAYKVDCMIEGLNQKQDFFINNFKKLYGTDNLEELNRESKEKCK